MPTSITEPEARPRQRWGRPVDRQPHVTHRDADDAARDRIAAPALTGTADLAPLPLRLGLGAGMLYHGAPKVFSPEAHATFVTMLEGIGVPLAGVMAWVVALVETVGGISLLLGSLTRIFASLLVADMLVALFTVHWAHGFSFLNITGSTDAGPTFGMPGWEVNLIYIAGLVALILMGPGRYALDTARRRHQEAVVAMPGGRID